MRLRLIPHPTTTAGPISGVSTEVARRGEVLVLRYRLEGALERVVWPMRADAGRADGLWRTTCFEAFVGDGSGPEGAGYVEYNLSPSGRWAGYRFDAPRRGMRPAGAAAVLAAEAAAGVLKGRIDLPPGAGRLGLAAVIEAVDGGLSYWALAHPGQAPDFHDPRGFVADI